MCIYSTTAPSFPAAGGLATLFVDGAQVGQGRVEATQPGLISLDETFEVGQVSTELAPATGAID